MSGTFSINLTPERLTEFNSNLQRVKREYSIAKDEVKNGNLDQTATTQALGALTETPFGRLNQVFKHLDKVIQKLSQQTSLANSFWHDPNNHLYYRMNRIIELLNSLSKETTNFPYKDLLKYLIDFTNSLHPKPKIATEATSTASLHQPDHTHFYSVDQIKTEAGILFTRFSELSKTITTHKHTPNAHSLIQAQKTIANLIQDGVQPFVQKIHSPTVQDQTFGVSPSDITKILPLAAQVTEATKDLTTSYKSCGHLEVLAIDLGKLATDYSQFIERLSAFVQSATVPDRRRLLQ